jgi:hypothetical protein
MEIFKLTLTVEGKEITYSLDINDKIVSEIDRYGLSRYISPKEMEKARVQLTEMVKAVYSGTTAKSDSTSHET